MTVLAWSKKKVTWSYLWMRGHWNTWTPQKKLLCVQAPSIDRTVQALQAGNTHFYGLRNCNESMEKRLIHYIYKQDSLVIVWILGLHKSMQCLNRQGAFQKPVIYYKLLLRSSSSAFQHHLRYQPPSKSILPAGSEKTDQNLGEQSWWFLIDPEKRRSSYHAFSFDFGGPLLNLLNIGREVLSSVREEVHKCIQDHLKEFLKKMQKRDSSLCKIIN